MTPWHSFTPLKVLSSGFYFHQFAINVADLNVAIYVPFVVRNLVSLVLRGSFGTSRNGTQEVQELSSSYSA